MDLEGGEFTARRQQFAHAGGLAGQHCGHGTFEHTRRATFFRRAADDRERQGLLHFANHDATKLGVGLDDQPACRRLQREPAAEAGL